MKALLDQEVPTDKPELISHESYWQTIKKNSALRPDANIKEVLRVTDVLESRVQQSFTRPAYKGMALRVINALAVHRLTVDFRLELSHDFRRKLSHSIVA